ncbi:MAG: nucleotidyl transferase AbiEii/AbiGii toxin family protein, partial [Actinobacteria bacterium]|nr:nucleotidyl transferase AbiEii/AbiGii toxin family protein [Actinomycetota bacterium]
IVQRDTQDVDLFSDKAGGPGAATGAVRAALEAAGYEVEVTRPPELNMGEFARLVVRQGDDAVQLDMARDWRKWPPVRLEVGPVLHVDDAVSSKVTAMVGRRVPRDFIDVAAALGHGYSRGDLMRLAFTRDPGLRVVDFSYGMRQFDQLELDDFADYGLDGQALVELRARFADWPRDEAKDDEGRAIQAAVMAEEQLATEE